MAITLDNTQELIERSFYEALRIVCVDLGYTPDITTYPNTPTGTEDYKSDLESILTDKGFALEVFGPSNAEDKGFKKYSRIVLNTEAMVTGEFGQSLETFYEGNPTDGYQPVAETQRISHQLYFTISIIGYSTREIRTLVSIINGTIPLMGYLPFYNDPENVFFVEATEMVDLSSATDGIQEKKFTYRIPDIIWTGPNQDDTPEAHISPITHINLALYPYFNTEIADYLGISAWIPEEPLEVEFSGTLEVGSSIAVIDTDIGVNIYITQGADHRVIKSIGVNSIPDLNTNETIYVGLGQGTTRFKLSQNNINHFWATIHLTSVGNLTSLAATFAGCGRMTLLESSADTKNIADWGSCFLGCSSLPFIPEFDWSGATNVGGLTLASSAVCMKGTIDWRNLVPGAGTAGAFFSSSIQAPSDDNYIIRGGNHARVGIWTNPDPCP